VGKAKNLKNRVNSYFSNKALDSKTLKLVNQILSLSFIQVTSEIEAFLLESALIKKYKPFFNIKLIDDKTYPYIEITKGNNPSLTITRKRQDKKADYFGPYSDATALKVVLKLLRKIFPYQSVKNHPKRKCLYYHLDLCPCVAATAGNLNTYKQNLKKIKYFLDGKKGEVVKMFLTEQKSYIKHEEFEKARDIQNKIDMINLITSHNFEPFRYIEKPDFYFERIGKEVTSLEEILKPFYDNLNTLGRIECYDISNFQGHQATGSMVVFINGQKEAKEYRRFKIKTKNTPDDFWMMEEVISRRFKKEGWTHPDLIVVDGGKGQIGAALKALANRKLRIPLIGLAKREETIVVPIKNQKGITFEEIKLIKSTPGVNLLRTIRDEAHRFAVTYHRLLRKKAMLPSG
jgi:excinuclease ABC subunit C